ncbi:uncharacterized protein LOC135832328 [Planococcus citri]|uniref:uncharacterized protein LOC135832328 n=1 Tax=Planococcus citri TaxID=170843 RepID=UPI0031F923BE
MIGWFCLWQLFISISNYDMLEAKPMSKANLSILEVPAGETAKLFCPSNDDNHRFQFWQLKSNEILGPGNRINERKYKYEVLSGTLYIKGVSPDEQGLYTCYCKHLTNTTFNAKSVMLEVRTDWQQLWENDEVNIFRMGAIFFVAALIVMVLYVIHNNIRQNQLMQFKDFTNENVLDEISSRKASYSLPRNGKNIELREGIDNPALDVQLSRETTPTYGYTSRGDSKF